MNRRNMPATYKQIDAYLGSKDARTIANNTTARRYKDSVTVALHGNDIAVLFEDGRIMVTSAGWQTVTTKDRLNRILRPAGYSISQKDYEWTLYGPDYSAPFEDGDLITPAQGAH